MTFADAPFEIERLGLTPSQAIILSAIGLQGPRGTSMIHTVIEDKSGRTYSRRVMSVNVNELRERGFVRMIPNTTGRHQWPTYTLTDKAKAFKG